MTLRKTLRTIGNAAGLFACAAIIVVAAAQIVKAAPKCGPWPRMAAMLEEKSGEHMWGWAIGDDGAIQELWARDDGSTWTLVVIHPTGSACVVSFGTDWNVVRMPGVLS